VKTYILEKGFIYKLFMFVAFGLFTLVMYQGHIKSTGIYTILFYASLILCSFQIVSFIYVLIINRKIEMKIDEQEVSWKIFDNKKFIKEEKIKKEKIKEVKTEISYLTGNVYSSFTTTFILDDDSKVILTDGMIYDFGLQKAEDLCRFMLDNDLGDSQDIKFSKLIKDMKIDINKELIFTKKDAKSYYVGVISNNKKEFLSLRLQIEKLYDDYKLVEKNTNNEYIVKSDSKKDSCIYLKSNAIGHFVEFENVPNIKELKTLKQMGKRNKISLF
jgi:hypothetical protein